MAIGGGLALAAKVGFDELSQMQKATAQTEAVLKSTGNAANVTSEHVRDLAQSISEYSGMDDEAIQAGENMLLTFHKIQNQAGRNNDVFDQATKATADLAQAMGIDMTRAALQIGKALNDPLRGMSRLQRIGVTFDEQQKKTIERFVELGDVQSAQRVILAELNKEFGGSAKAFGETMPGQIKIAQESFRNLAGEMTLALMPAITAVAQNLLQLAGFLREHKTLAKVLVIGLAGLAVGLLALSVAAKIAMVSQIGLNAALFANPIGLVVLALIALGAGLVVAWKKSETFRNIVTGAFERIRAVVDAVVGFVRDHWKLMVAGLAGPLGIVVLKIIQHWDKIKSTGKAAFDAIAGPIIRVIEWVKTLIGYINTAIGALRSLRDAIPVSGGGPHTIPPAFQRNRQHGGPVMAGMPYVVGERRPELFVPRTSGRILPRVPTAALAGGDEVRVIVVDSRGPAAEKWLRELQRRSSRSNGGRGVS